MSIPTAFPVARGQSQHRCIVVHSPQGGSLRTTTAVNLACGLAMTGDSLAPLTDAPGAALQRAARRLAAGPDSLDVHSQGRGEHLTVRFEAETDSTDTVLVDFSHPPAGVLTALGFTTTLTSPLTNNFDYVDRSVFDLIQALTPAWQPAQQLSLADLKPYLYRWEKHRAVGQRLQVLPGLLSPSQYTSQQSTSDRLTSYQIAAEVLHALKTQYRYVVVDTAQDVSDPLTYAALVSATDVLVLVPPSRRAILNAEQFVDLLKGVRPDQPGHTRWLAAAWQGSPTEPDPRLVTNILGIPCLEMTIPHDVHIARQAEDECLPYVLWDDSPLGESMRRLAEHYLRVN